MTTVAVVGTGRMGSAMARSLARSGSDLILQNRTPDRAAALASSSAGGRSPTPAEAAAAADVVITMLANEEAVESAWNGPDGLLSGARSAVGARRHEHGRRRTIIESFEAGAAAAGAGILDAPVSGASASRRPGKLTIMVGGTAEDLERARPVLEPLATSILHIGPLGTGAAMKLAVNTVIFGLNQSVAEALVLAERPAIDRASSRTTSSSPAPPARRTSTTSAPRSSTRSTRPSPSRSTLPPRTCGLILELADAVGALDAPGRASTWRSSGARERSAAGATSDGHDDCVANAPAVSQEAAEGLAGRRPRSDHGDAAARKGANS